MLVADFSIFLGRKSGSDDAHVTSVEHKVEDGLFQGVKFCFEFSASQSVKERKVACALVSDNGGKVSHGVNKQVCLTMVLERTQLL